MNKFFLVITALLFIITGCKNDDEFFQTSIHETDIYSLFDDETLIQLIPDYTDYIGIVDKELIQGMSPSERLKVVQVYKLAENISLVDSVYFLEITQNEAEELGVSKEVYEECLQNLLIINEEIVECKNNPNCDIYLLDYKSFIKERKKTKGADMMVSTKSGDPQSGTIIAFDNSWYYATFFPSIFHSKVRFTSMSLAAPLSVVTCSIEQWNNVHTGIGSGILGQTINITLNLFVSGSGVSAKLGFKTADSNGGRCNWRAVDDYGVTH